MPEEHVSFTTYVWFYGTMLIVSNEVAFQSVLDYFEIWNDLMQKYFNNEWTKDLIDIALVAIYESVQ